MNVDRRIAELQAMGPDGLERTVKYMFTDRRRLLLVPLACWILAVAMIFGCIALFVPWGVFLGMLVVLLGPGMFILFFLAHVHAGLEDRTCKDGLTKEQLPLF